MSVTIGSSAISSAIGGQLSSVDLNAEIARYKKELADCVNCSSSSTPEGKANIQEISNKISSDQTRLDQTEDSQTTTNNPVTNAANLNNGTNSYTAAGGLATLADMAMGSFLNVFA